MNLNSGLHLTSGSICLQSFVFVSFFFSFLMRLSFVSISFVLSNLRRCFEFHELNFMRHWVCYSIPVFGV